jgi:hypothetical protein
LADWITDLTMRYRDRVLVRLVDPRSPRGLWKALRYRAHRYPTFVVHGVHGVHGANGHTRVVGWDQVRLDAAVQAALAEEQRMKAEG